MIFVPLSCSDAGAQIGGNYGSAVVVHWHEMHNHSCRMRTYLHRVFVVRWGQWQKMCYNQSVSYSCTCCCWSATEKVSFNIQRAEVKTSVRNKVSTVGTIYNFHTIFFLFFSLFIHSWWMMLPPNVGPCSGSRVSQKAFCCTYAITVMYIVSYHTTPQLCFSCTSCAKNTVWKI